MKARLNINVNNSNRSHDLELYEPTEGVYYLRPETLNLIKAALILFPHPGDVEICLTENQK